VAELEGENLCGFIFKSDSPSSGMERVKVYDEKGMPAKTGVGIFARIFMEHFPCCRWRKKAGSTTRSFVKILSKEFLPSSGGGHSGR